MLNEPLGTRSRFCVFAQDVNPWRAILISMTFIFGVTPLWADAYRDCSPAIDVSRSIEACSEIIESGVVGRNLIDAYKGRSDAYYSMGDYDRAIADLDTAIERAPKDVELYVKRGFAFERIGNYERAVADFDMAIKLKPNRASLYTMRGGAYEQAGDISAAIADFERALEIDPTLQSLRETLQRLGGKP